MRGKVTFKIEKPSDRLKTFISNRLCQGGCHIYKPRFVQGQLPKNNNVGSDRLADNTYQTAPFCRLYYHDLMSFASKFI